MLHVSLYQDIEVSAEAYDPRSPEARVHINVRGVTDAPFKDRLAYLDITPEQARKLAEELLAAAAETVTP